MSLCRSPILSRYPGQDNRHYTINVLHEHCKVLCLRYFCLCVVLPAPPLRDAALAFVRKIPDKRHLDAKDANGTILSSESLIRMVGHFP